MNRKITGLLVTVISILFIIWLTITNKTVRYESLFITQSEWDDILKSKKISEELKLNYVKFNGYELILDSNNKLYYSLIENNSSAYNPTVSYQAKEDNIKLAILEKKITSSLIENAEEISILIYNDYEYNIYSIVCTTLPVMNITYNKELTITKKDEKINMSMYLFDNRSNASQRVIVSNGTIHARGSTSLEFPKKGFKISLTNKSVGENQRENNISLLGMRQDDDWILYASYNDQEKIRNVFSSNLWYESCAINNSFSLTNGMEYKYVELFLNNEYWGLYALGFPIDEKQLSINGDDEYIFKNIQWNNPKEDIIENVIENNKKLVNKVKNKDIAWQELQNYYTKLFTSKNKEELYSIVDIDNLIDYYLFNNFVQAIDNYKYQIQKNVYTTFKKIDERYVVLYTPWDLDYTFGNDYCNIKEENYTIYGISVKTNVITKLNSIYYLQQLGDENINGLIKNRYKELRDTYWSDDHISKLIDDYEAEIYNSGAFIRDMNKWPDGTYNDYNTKLKEFKEYVLERLVYTDEYINSME